MATDTNPAPPENMVAKPEGANSPTNLGRFLTPESKERSLKNRKPFKKGQGPPPGVGRPKKDGPASRELRRILRSKFPGDRQERSYMRLVIEGLVNAAIKGNMLAASLIFDRLEGRLPFPIEGEMPATIVVQVHRNVPRAECELMKESLLVEGNTDGPRD
jgi:hypothetical protein